MSAIFSLDIYYLVYFFALIFLASFAIPTGALAIIVSFASVASDWHDISVLVLISLVATISGDYGAYWLMRRLRHKINPIIKDVTWMKSKWVTIEKLFKKYSYWAVFLTRFLFSGVGPYVNFFSGLEAMSHLKYLRAVVLGELVYCLLYIFIGYFFRETWQGIIDIVQNYTAASIFALLGLYFVYKITKLVLKNKK
jgi:membrane protein DedA with SNARE-associated domain